MKIGAGSRSFAVSVILGIALVGCGLGEDSGRELKIDAVDRMFVDSLVLNISSSEGSARIKLLYPKDRVLLCAGSEDKGGCAIYEDCYWSENSELTEDRLVYEYSGVEDWGPRKLRRGGQMGFRGGIGYKSYPGGKGISLKEIFESGLIAEETLLGETLVARTYAEQFINGEWEKLTRFSSPGTAYFLAPQDTVRLRVKMGSMSVKYFFDRVVLSPEEDAIQRSRRFVVLKPRDGYWPFLVDKQEFFRTFSSDTLAFGEWFEFSYYVKPLAWHYSFDFHVLGNDGASGPRQMVEFYGPNMMIRETGPSRWTLLPRPGLELDEEGGDGYPGGPAVPEWAARKLILEYGQPFLAMNETNGALYRELVIDTMQKKRRR